MLIEKISFGENFMLIGPQESVSLSALIYRGDLMLAEFRCITNCIDSSIEALKMFSIGNAIHVCSFFLTFLLLLAANLSLRKMV